MSSGLTSNLPVADELRAIRKNSARLATSLGYKAVAKTIRAGGPLEASLRFMRTTLHGRTYPNPVTDTERRINTKVQALKDGIHRVEKRIKELGGA